MGVNHPFDVFWSIAKTKLLRCGMHQSHFDSLCTDRADELQLPREKRHKLVDSFLPIGIHLASERDLVKQHSNSRYTYIKLMITFLKKIWLSNVWNIQQHQFAVSFVTWMGDSDRLYPWIRGGMISKYYFILI